ncbi:hypothetical protein [Mesomycoplasma hyopneumoniae]|uniref:class III lanthionine synthetase LanKC N-terminal domain-containing protein n=1 Tax=Mesomycoplasma hyopneumoniae TaxID=2099 RepID=UPI003DA3A5B8
MPLFLNVRDINYLDKIKYPKRNVTFLEEATFLFIYFNDTKIPNQGWKIHISSLLKCAVNILQIVFDYCLKNKINFKFIKNEKLLLKNLSVNTDPFSFGKFITIYSESEENFKIHINWFYNKLKNFRGVNINSSRAFFDSTNIFYRYGTNYKKTRFLLGPNNQKIRDRKKLEYFLPEFINEPFPDNKSIFNFEKTILNYRFLILYLVQRTTISTVFFGQDINSKKFIILKASPLYAITAENITLTYFRRNEMKLLLDLTKNNFENSQQYVDSFVSQNNFYICKSFVNGKDLKFILDSINLVDKKYFNKESQTKYRENFKKAFNCVYNFHKKNIILNDVSAKNFVCDKLRCYFVDLETSYVYNSKIQKIWEKISLSSAKFPIKSSHFLVDILKLSSIFIESLIGSIQSLKNEFEIRWLFLSLYNFILFYNWPLWLLTDIFEVFRKQGFINKNNNSNLLKKIFDQPKTLTFKNIIEKIRNIYKIYSVKKPLKFSNFKFEFLYKIINNLQISTNLINKLLNYEKRFKFKNLKNFTTANLIFWGHWFFLKTKLFENFSNNFYYKKIIEYIFEKRVENVDGKLIVRDKKQYSPYIWNGSLGLCYLILKSKYKKYNKQIGLLEKSLIRTTSTKINFFHGISGFIHYFGQKKSAKIYYKQILRWIIFILNFWDDEKGFFIDNIFPYSHKNFILINSLIIETINEFIKNKDFINFFSRGDLKIPSYNTKIYNSILEISKIFA